MVKTVAQLKSQISDIATNAETNFLSGGTQHAVAEMVTDLIDVADEIVLFVEQLESTVGTNTSNITSNDGDISDLDDRVTALEEA